MSIKNRKIKPKELFQFSIVNIFIIKDSIGLHYSLDREKNEENRNHLTSSFLV